MENIQEMSRGCGQTSYRRKKNQKRMHRNKIFRTLFSVALLSVCIVMIWQIAEKGLPGKGWNEAGQFSGRSGGPAVSDTVEKQKAAGGGQEIRQIYENNKELLILVNKEHALDADYDGKLRNICNGRLQASERIYEDLVDLLAAGEDAGYTYWIASAYRSREHQEEVMQRDIKTYMAQGMSYEEAVKKTNEVVMAPGYSEHETGLALDILCTGNMNMDVSQALEPGNQWLLENGYKYGFVLRYPEDKADITQIAYEPWHFRYVGREAAEYLWTNQMTLEEFYENMQ